MDINNGAESGDGIGGQAKKRKRSGSREPEKKKRSSPEKDDEPLFNILENVSISKISEAGLYFLLLPFCLWVIFKLNYCRRI